MRAGGPSPVAPRSAPRSRHLLTRVLPGGVMVAAALALPEFSVGAGDLDGGEGRSDPPEPAARPEQSGVRRAPETARLANPKLAGVRYAPIIDLGGEPVQAIAAVPHRAALSASAISANPRELAEPAPVAAPEVKAAPVAPVAPALAAPPAAAPRVALVPQIAAAAVAVPAAAPAEIEPPAAPASAPAIAASETIPFATFLPEEREALRAPSGAAPAAPPAAPVSPAPAPRAPAALAATPPPVPVAAAVVPSAGRGAMAQLTSETIAAARPAAAPAPVTAPKPAPTPASAPLAAKPALPVAVAAPGARAPIAPTATPAPAPVAAKPVAAPAPARAAIVPKPAPAFAAPVSAEQARLGQFDFRAQLLTRIDGRTAGAVDFQQTRAGLKVRLGSVAEVLADRLPPAELARIRNSAAGNTWLSLPELQAQGVPISYDPVYDEFNIGQRDTRPKAASKVHIEQIGDALRRQEAPAAVPPAPRPR